MIHLIKNKQGMSNHKKNKPYRDTSSMNDIHSVACDEDEEKYY